MLLHRVGKYILVVLAAYAAACGVAVAPAFADGFSFDGGAGADSGYGSTSAATSGAVQAPVPDFSQAYGFGGVPTMNPGSGAASSGSQSAQPILDVNMGIDAGGVLGCHGMDINSMVKSTLNVGDISGQFQDYLQSMMAKQMLSLLYSSPEVSKVLDGMKAMANARVSMLQEKCDANEIMANATNARLRAEALDACLKDGNTMDDCQDEGGSKWKNYVEDLSKSKRWSASLHDWVCPEGSNSVACDMISDFKYDPSNNQGKTAPAKVSLDQAKSTAEQEVKDIMTQRVAKAEDLIRRFGYNKTLAILANGSCDMTSDEANAAKGHVGKAQNSCQDALAAYQQDIGPDACVAKESGGSELNLNNVTDAMDNWKDVNGGDVSELVKAVAKCQTANRIHPHVDVNIALLPEAEKQGAINAIAQNVAVGSAIKVNDALLFKLSEVLIQAGMSGGADKDNSMTPQMSEALKMTVTGRTMQGSALEGQHGSDQDLAATVDAMAVDQMARQKDVTHGMSVLLNDNAN